MEHRPEPVFRRAQFWWSGEVMSSGAAKQMHYSITPLFHYSNGASERLLCSVAHGLFVRSPARQNDFY